MKITCVVELLKKQIIVQEPETNRHDLNTRTGCLYLMTYVPIKCLDTCNVFSTVKYVRLCLLNSQLNFPLFFWILREKRKKYCLCQIIRKKVLF